MYKCAIRAIVLTLAIAASIKPSLANYPYPHMVETPCTSDAGLVIGGGTLSGGFSSVLGETMFGNMCWYLLTRNASGVHFGTCTAWGQAKCSCYIPSLTPTSPLEEQQIAQCQSRWQNDWQNICAIDMTAPPQQRLLCPQGSYFMPGKGWSYSYNFRGKQIDEQVNCYVCVVKEALPAIGYPPFQ